MGRIECDVKHNTSIPTKGLKVEIKPLQIFRYFLPVSIRSNNV